MELKTRKQAVIGNFKGVDFSSSPLLVAKNRAVDCCNFIFENGMNRKRPGWKEVIKVSDEQINGIFECLINGQKVSIVYVGTTFYKLSYDDSLDKYIYENITNTSSKTECSVDVSRLKNQRCQMFTNNGRFYFVGCGDYLTYGEYSKEVDGEIVKQYELRRVENDENTYIPTTSINIDADGVEGDIVESFESPNLLTNLRKNTFVGNAANSIFTVDAESIDSNTEIIVEHELINEDGLLSIKTYKNIENVIYDEESNVVGNVDFVNGKVQIFVDTTPAIEAETNLVITFSSFVDGYADRINNAELGVLFGVNGNPDRLFVSGNKEFLNYDFYSEMNDFTYFGDLNSCAIGSSESKIVGYSRLGDGTLATHKEEVNGEATIYYRTGEYNTEFNEDGSLSNVKAYFPIKAGTIGEAMVSRFANADLSGDKLFLSKNGVYGIVLSTNIASTERYSRERSQYIKEKITKHKNLAEAVGISFQNRYYLAIDNVCYIADARMTSQNTSDVNSFNYEWYYWDNMPVRVWAVINDELCFGTSDGRICRFDDEYSDRVYSPTSSGDLLINFDLGRVIFNKSWGIKNNDIIAFTTDTYRLKLLPESIIKIENNRIYTNEVEILTIYNKTQVYADHVEDSGLLLNKKYFIEDVSLSDCSFKLLDENQDVVEIKSKNFRLSENIKNKEYLVANLNADSFQLKQHEDGPSIDFLKYNDDISTQTPNAIFTIKKNVCSVWKSPVFDFGTNQELKTLLMLTISTEPTTNGKVDFGYNTRYASKELAAKGVNVFTFEDVDFNNFTFDTSFANSYTLNLKDYFNFIQFYFKSDNEYACGIHSLTITYKINNINKGVQ